REPAPAAAVVGDPVIPLVVEEGVVVAGRDYRWPRRGLGVAERLAEGRELGGGELAEQRRDRQPAARALAAPLSDLRATLDEAAELLGGERVAARDLLGAGRVELERERVGRRRLGARRRADVGRIGLGLAAGRVVEEEDGLGLGGGPRDRGR